MKQKDKHIIRRVDWVTILVYLLMIIAGWVAICGASYDFDMQALLAPGSRPMMQAVWMGAAVLIALIILFVDKDFVELSAPIFYMLTLILLLLTIFVAPEIKGSRSWLVMGPVRIQPAEFTKVATALILGWQFNKYGFELKSFRSYCVIFGLILAPMSLIILQNETGSALVFMTFFFALYREGFSGIFLGLAFSAVLFFVTALKFDGLILWEHTPADLWSVTLLIIVFTFYLIAKYCTKKGSYFWHIAMGSIALIYALGFGLSFLMPVSYLWVNFVILGLILVWLLVRVLSYYRLRYLLISAFAILSVGYLYSVEYVFDKVLQPHQQMRIKIALGIDQDLRGGGYNVDQSKIAIGSGGVLGKGFLDGTQTKLKYVPEQDTDFIFCTIGEEQGFVGSTLLISLFVFLILRIIWLGERQTSVFGRVYAYSVACILLFHLFINIGMVTGLVPVIGIPLPFFSYGGSSLWGFTILIFILLSIDVRR